MHSFIGIITYGQNIGEARDKAKKLSDAMIGEVAYPFDYGGTSGETMLFSSQKGVKLVGQAMEATKKHFLYAINMVREHLEKFTNEDIAKSENIVYDEKDTTYNTGMARHWMFKAGQYKGGEICLYDNDGEGIRTPEHLDRVLKQWDKPVSGEKIYVTPFNMHF
jgi:hypothetical protein